MNEFNFKSYDNSKQAISYCEIDKCKVVVNLRKKLQEVEAIAKECSEKYCEDCSIEKECVNGGYDLILKKISEVK